MQLSQQYMKIIAYFTGQARVFLGQSGLFQQKNLLLMRRLATNIAIY